MIVPDRVRVHPGSLSGTVRVPGDKSLSHRALILGALVGDPVEVAGVAPSGDVRSTASALRGFGASVDLAPDPTSGQLNGTVAGPLGEPDDVLDCGNSGTGLRLLAGVAAGIDGMTVLTGDASLRRRPMDRIRDPLTLLGARTDGRDGGRRPPIVVRGGTLHTGEYASPVASAQVKSCVLLAGLTGGVGVRVRSPLPSRDHTERLLTHLGGRVERLIGDDGTETVTLEPGPLTGRAITVPGDPSSAAFWLVAAAVAGTAVTVEQVCANPTRLGAVEVLRELGIPVTQTQAGERSGEPVADLTVATGHLTGARVDGRRVVDAIDELPVLALAGACSSEGIEVADAAELRVKESDRIATLAAAFRAIGLDLEEREDGYVVPGGQRPGPGTVHAHGDHRIAMTAAVAATVGTGPVEITGFAAVPTSYPSFLDDLRRLGGTVEVLDPPS